MSRRIIEKLKIPEGIHIRCFGAVWYRLLSRLENRMIRRAKLKPPVLNESERDIYITASLTSFPARIEYVHLAIKSLMQQSCKPDRIILWLAEEQFPDHQLPNTLTALEQYGLEIKWCDDLYGHKKYYYCVQNQQPNEVVITFDDDIIYSVDVIKRLVEKHREYPNCLVCERAQAIAYEPDGSLKNPGRWTTLSDVGCQQPSYSLIPSCGGGCLIPYAAFDKEVLNKEKLLALAPKNDDLWYMFMVAKNRTKIVKSKKYHKVFTIVKNSQTEQLATENIFGNRTKTDFLKLCEEYPKAYKRITTDCD